jgi:hypothetical protein
MAYYIAANAMMDFVFLNSFTTALKEGIPLSSTIDPITQALFRSAKSERLERLANSIRLQRTILNFRLTDAHKKRHKQ